MVKEINGEGISNICGLVVRLLALSIGSGLNVDRSYTLKLFVSEYVLYCGSVIYFGVICFGACIMDRSFILEPFASVHV